MSDRDDEFVSSWLSTNSTPDYPACEKCDCDPCECEREDDDDSDSETD